ncbi:MAG: hypothetical protein A3K11_11685 [Nitrospirae bacterium RIFCSPLOWO2_12_FULL_63_8]|nr:MAG: hypothetical protein A3K11_11685 [Nitrospirae bacterium RIFCSPLOWO2_12_FULL_63_8]
MSTAAWPRTIFFAILCCTLSLLWPCAIRAVQMVNDPQGFGGIAWGAAFPESEAYRLAESSSRIKGYELKQGPPPLGEARLEAMRFLTVNGKFARVVARYQGRQTHEQVVAYLETKYGPLDRTPGQFSQGVAQHFNWRGTETEINLTFDVQREHGLIFFESQSLMLEFQNP